jgi:hypothetical protein
VPHALCQSPKTERLPLIRSQTSLADCRIQTSNGSSYFNGLWVTAQVDIPTNYTCSSNCWWKMEIQNSQPHDRTTWSARIIGNPVRLVPNP